MDSKETFSVILRAVKILVSEKKIELYKECKFDVSKILRLHIG